MNFDSTSSTSFQNNFTQIIKRLFYSNVHPRIHILRMLLRTIWSKDTATFIVHLPTGRTRPGYKPYGINRNQLFSGMDPCGKTIQQQPRLQFMYNMYALYGIEPLSKEIAEDLINVFNLANVCIIEFRIPVIIVWYITYLQSCQHRPGSIPWTTTWKYPPSQSWTCFFIIDWSAST